MELKVQRKSNDNSFKDNEETLRIDNLRKEFNDVYETMDFNLALQNLFYEQLNVYQPKNKQNRTIAGTCARVLSALINMYRWQVGLTNSDIDKYGYFPASVEYLDRKYRISRKMVETASTWLIDWNLLEVRYDQLLNRPEFKKRYFKINIDVLEAIIFGEEK